MALSAESAGLVRQKAYNAVYGTGTGTSTNTVSPYHFYAIKAFFLHWAANKKNTDLAFKAYSAEDATTAGGTDLVGAACTVYAWFVKGRRTTGTTAAWEQLQDAAGNSTTTAQVASVRLNVTGDQALFVWPNGVIMATGANISSTTINAGSVESSAANSSDGFVIAGA